MRRRDLLKAGLLGTGAQLVAPRVAGASHISEPTHPISSFELTVEKYDTNEQVVCGGIAPGRKLRIQPIAESDAAWSGPNGTGVPGHHDPSEHFSTGWQIDRKVQNPKNPNLFSWVMEERTVWAHSNIPGDTESKKFNVAYATITPGEPNGGSSTVLSPGTYRITAELLADVSGLHYVQVCTFTVT